MRRTLFNLATAASLALCVAVVTLRALGPVTVGAYDNAWAGEPGRGDSPVTAFGHAFAFRSVGGTMRLHWHYIRRPDDRLSIGSMWGDAVPNRAGFAWNVAPTGGMAPNGKPWARQGTVAVPHWFAIVGSAVLPGLWLYRRQRAGRRSRRGLCLTCGYDLRASLDRCPECGAAPPAAPKAAA